jgi:phosphopantothenoylcysteine decarboxylase
MANILLGVTGSVAAVKVPQLFALLKGAGHSVKVVATRASLYFFNPVELDLSRSGRNPEVVVLDEDEWPEMEKGKRYQVGEPVPHIELRRWGELLCVAPLDANTLAKFANGLADNCLTSVWRAWDPSRPVVLAPAMNTLMWEHPLTGRHLRQINADAGGDFITDTLPLDEIVVMMNRTCPRLRVVAPVSKRLACGDVGVGGLGELGDIVATVEALV